MHPGPARPGRRPGAAMAAIALEDRGDTPGRVRMQRLPSGTGGLAAFAGRVVEPGTLVRAVRLPAWWPLAELGFMTERAPTLTHLPAVERALADWLRGTHQGATSPAQLDWYLDEFTFRFNRRTSTHRGLLFYRLLEESVVTPPSPTTGSSAPPTPPPARAPTLPTPPPSPVPGPPPGPGRACCRAARPERPYPLRSTEVERIGYPRLRKDQLDDQRKRSEHMFDSNICSTRLCNVHAEGKPWTGPPCAAGSG